LTRQTPVKSTASPQLDTFPSLSETAHTKKSSMKSTTACWIKNQCFRFISLKSVKTKSVSQIIRCIYYSLLYYSLSVPPILFP
jgi:hypothetical protein